MVKERMIISGSLDELSKVHEWAKSQLMRISMSEPERHNVLLALSEAASNAIRHGCKEDPDRKIEIAMTEDDLGLTISIKDDGEGFTPDEIPDPTEGANLLRAGGRGIYLLKALSSEVQFKCSPKGTTVMCRFKPN